MAKLQQGGGDLFLLRKPTSFGCVLRIKRLEEIQFVKEGDNQLYIPRPCVWVFDFRSARSVFGVFLGAPL